MFTTLKNAFKIKEIRNKIFFTFLMLVVIRLGSQLPVPGVDRTYFARWFESQTGDAFNFFDAFTGGSFLNMSVLALNITPYITSSIIMQLLTIAIQKLEEMQRDGEDGRKKIQTFSRYLTVALALIEKIEISMEEYSTDSEIKTISVEKSDISHIEPEAWSIVKHMENQNTCKDIIAASKNVTKIQENVEQFNNTVDMNSLRQTFQQYATLYEGLAKSIKPIQTNGAFAELTKQTAATQKALSAAIMPLQANSAFSELAKQASLYQSAFSAIKPLQANGAFSELAKQASLYQSALSAIKPLQANSAFSELTKQFSANKKMNESTDDQE